MNSHDISAITCQASVPSHLEDQLSRLEAVADEFRARTLRYLDHLGSSWINLMKIDETAIRHERFFWVMVNSPEDHEVLLVSSLFQSVSLEKYAHLKSFAQPCQAMVYGDRWTEWPKLCPDSRPMI